MALPSKSFGHSLLLLLTAVIWGFAFVAQRAGMEHIGPFLFNGCRFLLGSLSLLPILLVRSRRMREISGANPCSPTTRAGLALVGVVLFGAAALQQAGLVYTTAGKAGFITGLYVLLVPVIGRFLGQQVTWKVWTGAAAAVGGLYLLVGFEEGGTLFGDGLVLAGAFGWAVHVQLVGWLVRRIEPMRIAFVQTAVCGMLSLAVASVAESMPLLGLRAAVPAIAFAGIFSVGIAYTLQIVGQRHVDPSRAGILVSLEAVFAVFGGWLLLGEQVTGVMLLGAALMLSGMILAQVRRRARAIKGSF